MIINNIRIVLPERIIGKGYIAVTDGKISAIGEKPYAGNDKDVVDGSGKTAMPGFIDVHIHGSKGIDFMDAEEKDYPIIAKSLYEEGVTTFLATTLTSDVESMARVCRTVKAVKDSVPSLGGIHFEGPYINAKHKGAQNEAFIRNPSIAEFDMLNELSGNNVRYITMAPEKEGAYEFIAHLAKEGVTCSAGHSDATFAQVEEAIHHGLTNTTHTHNAMSGHHHRNPGIVTAAFYFDSLYTEFICDTIHVCRDVLKASYKVIGPERFVMITDALKVKHSDVERFQLFGLDCERKNGAAYLLSGPLAGSLLSMDQGLRNMKEITSTSLSDLSKITSRNAARSAHFTDRGEIKVGNLADIVLLDNDLHVTDTYKLGKKVY